MDIQSFAVAKKLATPQGSDDRYVTVAIAEARTGYSQKAIRRKIESGVWIEGRQYTRSPDRRIAIDLWEVEAWRSGRSIRELRFDRGA